jgi:hypothetical protein
MGKPVLTGYLASWNFVITTKLEYRWPPNHYEKHSTALIFLTQNAEHMTHSYRWLRFDSKAPSTRIIELLHQGFHYVVVIEVVTEWLLGIKMIDQPR